MCSKHSLKSGGFAPVAMVLALTLLPCGALVEEAAAETDPLLVFILTGQSNMQGHAHVRTMDVMAFDPVTAPILEEMRDADGEPKVLDGVWISSIGSSENGRSGPLTAGYGPVQRGPKIGPEFTFGIYAQKLFPGREILIIKTAWGGKSLNTDFRSPSAGPYEFSETQLENLRARDQDVEKIVADRAAASGHYYRLMLEHVDSVLGSIGSVVPDYDAEQGYELGGLVWFQGWNDMVDGSTYPNRAEPGGYDLYAKLMATFIRDVRKDLEAPELPFVIGVMGAGGDVDRYPEDKKRRYGGIHQGFRDAMAAPTQLDEFQGNVEAVYTGKYWDYDLAALRDRESGIKPEVDAIRKAIQEGDQARDQGEAAIEALYGAEFSEQELFHLRNGASNAEYHYWGSAKTMAQIGKAFAEAMANLVDPREAE